MLRFAALHKIKPQIEEFAFEDVNKGIQRVKEGKARRAQAIDFVALQQLFVFLNDF